MINPFNWLTVFQNTPTPSKKKKSDRGPLYNLSYMCGSFDHVVMCYCLGSSHLRPYLFFLIWTPNAFYWYCAHVYISTVWILLSFSNNDTIFDFEEWKLYFFTVKAKFITELNFHKLISKVLWIMRLQSFMYCQKRIKKRRMPLFLITS